jgi:hypothetical protein
MSLISLANRSAAAVRVRQGDDFEDMEVPAPGTPPPAAANAIDRLVEFIPVETVTIFWLAVPAAALLARESATDQHPVAHPTAYDLGVYFALIALTPVLLLLKFLSQSPRDDAGKLPGRADWPWWYMGVATVAFALWALAVPGNPFLTTPGRLMIMWSIAAAVTMILGYLDKIFFRRTA